MHAHKIHYLKKQIDEVMILSFFVKISLSKIVLLSEEEQLILTALKRASHQFEEASLAETGDILASYDEEQIAGLVNNVKGIAHEMQFVQLENADGDSIHATMYKDSNHPEFDVVLTDSHTGMQTQVQLKATDDKSYVNEWLNQDTDHTRENIYITEELAHSMRLPSSGVSNEGITESVDTLIDKLIAQNDNMLGAFPLLTAATASVVIYQLWQRYQKKEISYQKFKRLAKIAVGKKAVKIGTFTALLSIPGINMLVATGMLTQLIYKLRKV